MYPLYNISHIDIKCISSLRYNFLLHNNGNSRLIEYCYNTKLFIRASVIKKHLWDHRSLDCFTVLFSFYAQIAFSFHKVHIWSWEKSIKVLLTTLTNLIPKSKEKCTHCTFSSCRVLVHWGVICFFLIIKHQIHWILLWYIYKGLVL